MVCECVCRTSLSVQNEAMESHEFESVFSVGLAGCSNQQHVSTKRVTYSLLIISLHKVNYYRWGGKATYQETAALSINMLAATSKRALPVRNQGEGTPLGCVYWDAKQ